MKRISLLLAAAATISGASLLGCATANKFIGTWEAQISQLGQTGSMTQTINPDGTFNGDMTMKIPTGDVHIKVDGTWTSTDEKTLTLTQKNITTTGLPKEVEALAKSQIESAKDKPQTMTVTWSGNDEFTASGAQGAGSIVFKRKK